MKTKIIIGIGGVARVGKNLFADIVANILKEKYNKSCKSFALAYYLKKDCEEFIKQKLNMNVWSELTQEKDVFRPMLVWYGGVKRKQTQGRYWIEMLQKDIETSEADINIITDIRYSVYDKDEVYWIKNEMNGTLIHLSKYSFLGVKTNRFQQPQQKKVYVEAANDQEMINDPIVKRNSDIQIEWEDASSRTHDMYSLALKDQILTKTVDDVLSKIING
jgi:hypothetical protein